MGYRERALFSGRILAWQIYGSLSSVKVKIALETWIQVGSLFLRAGDVKENRAS